MLSVFQKIAVADNVLAVWNVYQKIGWEQTIYFIFVFFKNNNFNLVFKILVEYEITYGY